MSTSGQGKTIQPGMLKNLTMYMHGLVFIIAH